MFYYYFRVTFYLKGEGSQLGFGSFEIALDRPITHIKEIREIERKILETENVKNSGEVPEGKELCVIIDNYIFLREE